MSKESRLAEVEARYAKERLEAAAPELLAALKDLLRAVTDEYGPQPYVPEVVTAEALIAKMEGR